MAGRILLQMSAKKLPASNKLTVTVNEADIN